jgi:hypothetical protein
MKSRMGEEQNAEGMVRVTRPRGLRGATPGSEATRRGGQTAKAKIGPEGYREMGRRTESGRASSTTPAWARRAAPRRGPIMD